MVEENTLKNVMKLKLTKPINISGELKYKVSSGTIAKLEDLAKGRIDEIQVTWNRYLTHGVKDVYMIWTRHSCPNQRFACMVYDVKTPRTLPLVDFDFMPGSVTAEYNVLPMGDALSQIHPMDYSSDSSFLEPILFSPGGS